MVGLAGNEPGLASAAGATFTRTHRRHAVFPESFKDGEICRHMDRGAGFLESDLERFVILTHHLDGLEVLKDHAAFGPVPGNCLDLFQQGLWPAAIDLHVFRVFEMFPEIINCVGVAAVVVQYQSVPKGGFHLIEERRVLLRACAVDDVKWFVFAQKVLGHGVNGGDPNAARNQQVFLGIAQFERVLRRLDRQLGSLKRVVMH